MKLDEMLDLDNLAEMLAEGYIRAKQHPTLDLTLYNYTELAQYGRVWNNETKECRGLIVGPDGTVISRPFPKFFNYEEAPEFYQSLTGPVEVTDKLDGSLGIHYFWNGKRAIATRGSFTSDQAKWATEWLNNTYPNFSPPPGLTALFEIVYPQNRIVLDYGQFAGLVLLGYRGVSSGQLFGPEYLPDYWHGHRAEVIDARNIYEALSLKPRENAEGVVVRWTESHQQCKVKQEDYVRAHAVVTNMTNRAVWNALAVGDSLLERTAFMPDEFFDWLQRTADQLKREHFALQVRVRLQYDAILEDMRNAGEYTLTDMGCFNYSRREFAMRAKDHEYSAALFRVHDGKEIESWAWAQLRPATIERPWTNKEDDTNV